MEEESADLPPTKQKRREQKAKSKKKANEIKKKKVTPKNQKKVAKAIISRVNKECRKFIDLGLSQFELSEEDRAYETEKRENLE